MSWMTALGQTVDNAIAPARAARDNAQRAVAAASGEGGEGGASGESQGASPQRRGGQASEAAVSTARAVQSAAGTIGAVAALPMELANTGIAALTNPIAAAVAALPAATVGSLYIGIPHAHSHPPSLVPPAPPVPLPDMGAITVGGCMQVLICGLPAARAGSIGITPTCVGLMPFFYVFLGSSNVFIGGMRAARATDVCMGCTPPLTPAVSAASMAMKALGAAAKTAAIAGIMASAGDAATSLDTNVQVASGLNAAMAAAQMVADAQAAAMEAMLGKDPAIPPALPGMIGPPGAPTVLIGGIPIPNTADIAKMALNKIKGRRAQVAFATAFQLSRRDDEVGAGGGCG